MIKFPKIDLATRSCTIVVLILAACGCRSSSYARRGATSATASPAIGTSLADIDARNRVDIATHLGRPVAPGPATPAEVAAMTHAGVEPRFIISYINGSTNTIPLTAADVIYLHQQGVNEQIIQAMLTPGSAYSRAEVARTMPPRILIIGDPWGYYGDPYDGYPHCGYAYGVGYGCRCY
jgi:hypothetical protein